MARTALAQGVVWRTLFLETRLAPDVSRTGPVGQNRRENVIRPIPRSSSRPGLQVLVALVALALILPPGSAVASSPIPVFEETWGAYGSGELKLNNPMGISIAPTGKVFVADTQNQRIQVFNRDGSFDRAWGWGVDTGASRFEVCIATCQQGLKGSGKGQFDLPWDVTVTSTGDVYVADFNNNRIQKFTSAGIWAASLGVRGAGAGQFDRPSAVATDAVGNVYVADYYNHRIEKFPPSLDYRAASWGSLGSATGEFTYPTDVNVGPDGYVYVADPLNNRIQKFTSTGTFLSTWGIKGTGDSEFWSPAGIDFDSQGNIYVADANNDRIQRFDPSGSFLSKWGSSGTGDGLFMSPRGVAVDDRDRIFVTDTDQDRIQIFGWPTTSLSIKAPRRVSIGSRARITGRLGSSDQACSAAQQITLKRGPATLGTQTTSSSGGYRFVLRVKRKMRIQVIFPGTLGCGASASARKTIRVG